MNCYRSKTFEEFPALSLDIFCLSIERDRTGETFSHMVDISSVTDMLRKCHAPAGITFRISKRDQRPWTPPIGYMCVYYSLFDKDMKL